MNHENTTGGLSSENEDVELFVEAGTESFETFDRWMDDQLGNLVARWAHMAAPNASLVTFRGRLNLKD